MLPDNESLKLFVDISKNIGEINGNLKQLCNTIAQHEVRIAQLEQAKSASLKDDILKLSLKALIIAVTAIASLVGASGLITKILG